MPTTPIPISALPDPPDREDTSTFSPRAMALAAALKDHFVGEVNASAAVTNANAMEALASSLAAAASAYDSAIFAANAAAATGAAMWVSGASYPTVGIPVWSPANRLIYRRIVAGAGTIDPSLDPTNWAPVGVVPQPVAPVGSNIFLATTFGAL